MTRSQAWDRLEKEGHISNQVTKLSKQVHKRKNSLINIFEKIDSNSQDKETDMYPGIIEAIQKALYDDEGIFIVDTHSKGTFHADISVAHYKDSRFPYSFLYFIELKMLKGKLNTSENSGQVLDHFNAIYEKQPNRSKFVAILSNFQESWVYNANYSYKGVTIDKQCVLEAMCS